MAAGGLTRRSQMPGRSVILPNGSHTCRPHVKAFSSRAGRGWVWQPRDAESRSAASFRRTRDREWPGGSAPWRGPRGSCPAEKTAFERDVTFLCAMTWVFGQHIWRSQQGPCTSLQGSVGARPSNTASVRRKSVRARRPAPSPAQHLRPARRPARRRHVQGSGRKARPQPGGAGNALSASGAAGRRPHRKTSRRCVRDRPRRPAGRAQRSSSRNHFVSLCFSPSQ